MRRTVASAHSSQHRPAFAVCRDPVRAGAAQAGAKGRRDHRQPQSWRQERPPPLGVCSRKGLLGECSGEDAARNKADGPKELGRTY